MKPARIDLYLAATMRPSEDLDHRLARASVDPGLVKAVAEEAERSVFVNPLAVNPASLLQFFGPPSRDEPLAISYDLSLWPDHRYHWYIDDGGLVSHGGFSLRTTPDLPQWLSTDLVNVSDVWKPWYHTMAEVERAFGKPDREFNWFPQQEWHYGPLADGRELVCVFDLGLLRQIQKEDLLATKQLDDERDLLP